MDRAIFQQWLDDVGEAVVSGAYDTYAAAIALPFTLVTEVASLTVATDDDLREGFDTYRAMLAAQRVTHMVRLSSGVVSIGQSLIVGNYTTHLLDNARPVVAPISSSMTLRRAGEDWKAVVIVNATTNPKWPIDLPRPGPAQ